MIVVPIMLLATALGLAHASAERGIEWFWVAGAFGFVAMYVHTYIEREVER